MDICAEEGGALGFARMPSATRYQATLFRLGATFSSGDPGSHTSKLVPWKEFHPLDDASYVALAASYLTLAIFCKLCQWRGGSIAVRNLRRDLNLTLS